jgi:hypothetical protein
MEYIKTYEKILIKDKKYWLIPTDGRLEDSLNKIGCEDNEDHDYKQRFLRNPNFEHKENRLIFILTSLNSKGRKYWGWNIFEGDLYPDWAEDENYEFAGMINISDLNLEIAAIKYNL